MGSRRLLLLMATALVAATGTGVFVFLPKSPFVSLKGSSSSSNNNNNHYGGRDNYYVRTTARVYSPRIEGAMSVQKSLPTP
jgi:hypothetical protein